MFRIGLLITLVGGPLTVPSVAREKAVSEGRIEEESNAPASEKVTVGVVVAEFVLLHDRRIRTWDELLDDLRCLRKESSKPLLLDFRVTVGAVETRRMDRLETDIAAIDPAIVEQSDIRVGEMSAANSVRYDSIETEADLVPKPGQIRRGSVRTRTGRPVRNGIVLLIAIETGRMPPFPTPECLQENQLDEIWSRVDRDGNFEIVAPDENYRVAVISPMGFAFGQLPDAGKAIELTIEPAATLEVASARQVAQEIALVIRPEGLPDEFMGFGMFKVDIGKAPLKTRLPKGVATVYQIRERGNGSAELIRAKLLELNAGGQEKVVLDPLEWEPAPE